MAIRKGMWTTIKPVPKKTKTGAAGKKKKNRKNKTKAAPVSVNVSTGATPEVSKTNTAPQEPRTISSPAAGVQAAPPAPVSPQSVVLDDSKTTGDVKAPEAITAA